MNGSCWFKEKEEFNKKKLLSYLKSIRWKASAANKIIKKNVKKSVNKINSSKFK